jgi:ubiquinone/menaquinone biosynthesis C-methylase UbiE
MYTPEPKDKKQFTQDFDRVYGRFAKGYDWIVKVLPLWRNWISSAIPHIVGPDVLEISFGTGYLISQYANQYNTHGIDYNWELARVAQRNLSKYGAQAQLQLADAEHLPYPSETFDTVVNTMAFSGYPDGFKALTEIRRIIKESGRLVMVDIDYPQDENWLGMQATRFWASAGDIIRDMGALFEQVGFSFSDHEVGGFGSVHLYVAMKNSAQS